MRSSSKTPFKGTQVINHQSTSTQFFQKLGSNIVGSARQDKTPPKTPKRQSVGKSGGTPSNIQEESELKSKVQIVIRVRPSLENESQEQFINQVDVNAQTIAKKIQTLRINRPGNNLHMKFNNILPSQSSQEEVYQLAHESVLSFLSGTSNTIFAYGQTGAGKTYTILGDHSENPSQLSDDQILQYLQGADRGILPRSLFHILKELSKKKKEDYRLYISFFEVYNEKIYDLFNKKDQKDGLEIRESSAGDVQIPDLITVEIKSVEQALEILMVGLRNRATGSTMANAKSSRSHSIFQILLQQKLPLPNQDDIIIESTLRIVDLAGSEKFKIPHDISPEEREVRIAELTCINGSLSSLGHCISALIDKNRTHIPFRNSKLTRALSDSLSGGGKISFIVCVSPSMSSSSETFSTLQFANRAKRAVLDGRNLRQENKMLSEKRTTVDLEEYQELSRAYAKERALREELEKQLKKSSSNIDLEIENIQLKRENQELKLALSQMKQGIQSDQRVQISSEMSNLQKESLFEDQNLENLSIFKEIQNVQRQKGRKEITPSKHQNNLFNKQQKPSLSLQNQKVFFSYLSPFSQSLSLLKEQQISDFNSLNSNQSELNETKVGQFWHVGEGEDQTSHLINFCKVDQSNKLMQRAKQIEIQQKFEQFFAYNSSDVQKESRQNKQLSQTQNLQPFKKEQILTQSLPLARQPLEQAANPQHTTSQNVLQNLSQNSATEEEFVNRMISMVSAIQKKQVDKEKQSQQSQNQGENQKYKRGSNQIEEKQEQQSNQAIKENDFKPKVLQSPVKNKTETSREYSPSVGESSLNFDTNQTGNTYNKNFDSIIQKVQGKSQNISNIVHDLKQEMSKAISQLHMLQQADQEIRMSEDISDNKGYLVLGERKNDFINKQGMMQSPRCYQQQLSDNKSPANQGKKENNFSQFQKENDSFIEWNK